MVKTPAFHAGIVGSNPARVTFGGLAQLGEHLPYKQGVTGSSPVSSIYNLIWLYIYPLHDGSVAQLVEQRIEAPCVGGSIPSRAIYGGVAKSG